MNKRLPVIKFPINKILREYHSLMELMVNVHFYYLIFPIPFSKKNIFKRTHAPFFIPKVILNQSTISDRKCYQVQSAKSIEFQELKLLMSSLNTAQELLNGTLCIDSLYTHSWHIHDKFPIHEKAFMHNQRTNGSSTDIGNSQT